MKAATQSTHRFLPLLRFTPLALLLMIASLAQADTLLIDRTQHAQEVRHPKRGALMSQVEAEFGAPLQRVSPVGEPPITRWVYAEITVYFENDHVISSVLNKSSGQEQGPKPVHG